MGPEGIEKDLLPNVLVILEIVVDLQFFERVRLVCGSISVFSQENHQLSI